MKKISFILGLMLTISLIFSSCEKTKDEEKAPENYEEITLDDIVSKEETMSRNPIEVTNSNGHILDRSDVIIYKTNSGQYGKLKILRIDDDYDDKLIIEATTFNDYGNNYHPYLNIRKNHNCDLDSMVEDLYEPDFKWKWVNSTDAMIIPMGAAVFAIYEF